VHVEEKELDLNEKDFSKQFEGEGVSWTSLGQMKCCAGISNCCLSPIKPTLILGKFASLISL